MRKYIFWGMILIVIGLLWLLKLTHIIYFSWMDFLSLWPLILIWVGISVLPIKDGYKIGLDVLTVGLGLLLILTPMGTKKKVKIDIQEYEQKTTHYYVENNDYLRANLVLNAGATELRFVPGNEQLLTVKGKRSNDVELDIFTKDSSTVDINLKILPKKNIFHDDHYNIVADTSPVWNMDINLGASDNHIDLSAFKIEKLNLSTGASEVFLKISDLYPFVEIIVNTGASDIEIKLPKSMDCSIETETALSGTHFYGFTEENGRMYAKAVDGQSKGIIKLKISAGVSDIEVSRY